MGYKHNLIHLK